MAEAQKSDRLPEWFACGNPGAEEMAFENLKFYNACLKFATLGQKTPIIMGCREMHSRAEGTGPWVIHYACPDDNFYFEPNGHFHRGYFHGFVEDKPKDDRKDSLIVSVGKCASFGD